MHPLWNRASASKHDPETSVVQQSVDMVDPPVFLRIAHAYHGFEAVNHLARAKTMDEAVPFNLSQHPHAVIVF